MDFVPELDSWLVGVRPRNQTRSTLGLLWFARYVYVRSRRIANVNKSLSPFRLDMYLMIGISPIASIVITPTPYVYQSSRSVCH